MKIKTILIALAITSLTLFSCDKQTCSECITLIALEGHQTTLDKKVFCDLSQKELNHYEDMNTYRNGTHFISTKCE